MKIFTVVGAALVLLNIVQPPTAHADSVDDYVRAAMKRQHIPGLSLAVIKNGKTVKSAGYGFADTHKQVPATADTVYEIGSLTKQFTATAILLLVEQGKLRLDDKIGMYLHDVPGAWKSITIRQLLTHTSGIKNYTALPDFPKRMARPITEAGLIRSVANYPLDFPPGTKWSYSNTGYFLLGMVAEKVSGESYAVFLKRHIFTPLQMTSTAVAVDNGTIPRLAKGYHWTGSANHAADAISMTYPFAAGAIVSTVRDMAKWDNAMHQNTLLKKSSQEAMWTPATLADGKAATYGFGWAIGAVRGHRMIDHAGGIPGFSTYIARFPNDGWSVVVLTNQDEGSNPAGIGRAVLGRYFAALSPPVHKTVTDTEPQRTTIVRRFYEQAAQGKFDTSPFTSQMASIIAPQLSSGLSSHLHNLKVIQSMQLLERKTAGTDTVYLYRLTYQEGALRTQVTFDKAGKISGMTLNPE